MAIVGAGDYIGAEIAKKFASEGFHVHLGRRGGDKLQFPILETTDRVFHKVWQMACFAGFVTGREAARIILPRKRGKIFFTGATAGLRGGAGYAAFASAKFGIRAVAQSMTRELWPSNIHVAHLIIDAGVDTQWVREIIGSARAPKRSTISSPTN
ncbi:SDR family NAD(P)-dependent oxidoreductase [Sphingobium sp. JS3065]|uniref:SDR family NAD(P)-dependent oxidoreductase n=1 Tax=Sphingobium sp. JS3065 TaxID=2970925 RepID=UPI002263BD2E|nr:SDR family NAD(P)-dependent oxidoreductase [Sphingobium sp. JS3065]UZW57136.1 SDR family NAD(P)-dependent oxidoreductase [Sphingobium sp. JS3065]